MRRILLGVAAALAVIATSATLLRPTPVDPVAIQTSVTRSPERLEQAWRLPVAASYRRGFSSQPNPSLCGPTSLANAFRSLGEGPTSEKAVLDGTGLCWTGYCILGLTLDELAEVARAHTERKVSVIRNITADEFREHLRRSNDPARRYVINFDRKSIFQGGTGHHSPIGGYLEEQDLVFVLDVNRDYQPWLIERSRLFAAMNTMDGDRKRGMLLIRPP